MSSDDQQPQKHRSVEVLARERVYDGFFHVDKYRLRHRKFDGEWTGVLRREVFERGHAVGVLPYDPVRDRVVLVEQFRIGAYAAGQAPWLFEIPAGIIEPGENAQTVARRETREETGCRLQELVPIMEYFVSPGGTTESITLFCGRVETQDSGGIHGDASEGEDIRVFTLPAGEAKNFLAQGRIKNAAAVIALQWFALNHEGLYKSWAKAEPRRSTP